jgi:hypothetical protein
MTIGGRRLKSGSLVIWRVRASLQHLRMVEQFEQHFILPFRTGVLCGGELALSEAEGNLIIIRVGQAGV